MTYFRSLSGSLLIIALITLVARAPSVPLDASKCHALRSSQAPDDIALYVQLCADVVADLDASAIVKRDEPLLDRGVNANVAVNIFRKMMKKCNEKSSLLEISLNDLLSTTIDVLIGPGPNKAAPVASSLNSISLTVEASLNLPMKQKPTPCSSCNVPIAPSNGTVVPKIYKDYGVFVGIHVDLLTHITANISAIVEVESKDALHASLVRFQNAVSKYHSLLFLYISPTLDVNLNLRETLDASVKAAVNAVATLDV